MEEKKKTEREGSRSARPSETASASPRIFLTGRVAFQGTSPLNAILQAGEGESSQARWGEVPAQPPYTLNGSMHYSATTTCSGSSEFSRAWRTWR